MKRLLSLVVAILLLLPMIASSVMATDLGEYEITKEPTNENLTVEVNDKDGATYQWYEVTSGEITDKNAKGFEYFMLLGKAEYNSEKGWSSAYLQMGESYYSHFFFEVEINEGETLYIKALSDFASITLHDATTLQSITCNAVQTADGILFSNITSEKVVVGAISYFSEAYIKAEIKERQSLDVAIENETSNTLNSYELGKSYACMVKWNDGTELVTNIISFIPDIITQPTGDNPKVEVSFKDYAKFEWYNVKNEAIDVTDENAEIIDGNSMIEKDVKSSYDKENGWTPIENKEEDSDTYHYYFTVDLKANDTFKIYTDIEIEKFVLIDMSKFAMAASNENGVFEILEDGSYILVATNGNGESIKAQILRGTTDSKIDGQNTNELTKCEPNQKYICKVIWTKGESTYEADSKVVKMEYAIITEPTCVKPTIEVNFKDLVEKYEWYQGIEEKVEVTDEIAEACEDASYSEADGWIGGISNMGTKYFQIELNKGDTLVVTHTPNGSVLDDFYLEGMYDIEATSGSDGERVFVAEADGIYMLLSNPAMNMTNVRAYLVDIEISDTPIENQNTDTLTDYEIDKYYQAKVTYKDGTTLVSDIFRMEYAIISQPTNTKPTIETNKNEDIIEYKWYLIKKLGLYDIVSNNGVVDGKIFPEYIYEGYYQDEQWIGDDGYINIGMPLIDGDVLKITPDEGFKGFVGLYGEEEGFEFIDGSYYYEKEDGKYADFEIEDEYGNKITAIIEVIRYGETYKLAKKAAFDDKNGVYTSPDIDEGYFEDGKWYSEEETSNDTIFQQIDIEFKLEDEYIITVKLSDDFDGEVIIDDFDTGEDHEIEYEDKIAIITSDIDAYNFEINLENDEKFSAEIILTYNGKDYMVGSAPVFNEEDKTYTDVYANDGYYKDGLWMSGGIDNEIDIEIDLDKGSTIIITVSDNFDGEVYLDDIGVKPIYLEGKDGVYKFLALEAISPDVQLDNYGEDFSAKIQIERGEMLLLEDQITKTLSPNEIGNYYVEVIFENGQKLISNIVEINSQVMFDTNGGTSLNNLSTMKLTEIAKTEREGFILDGWYLDEKLTEKVSLPYDVMGLVTLYAKWTVCDHKDSTQKPTCTENTTCTVCGGEYKATGHNYSLDYAKNENSHYYECTVCGNKKNESEHTFSEWIVTKFPERTTQGEEKQVCTVCSQTVTRATEPLGGLSSGATVGIIVGTGALLSALAVGMWFILKRRK